MISLLPLFVVWGFILLYGLVYLAVDSELLERPRKWFTSAVPHPEDAAIEALLAGEETKPSTETLSSREASPRPNCIRVFVGRVLSCWMCSAGWAAIPSAGLVVLFALSLEADMYWAAVLLSVLMVPPTGIGFVAMVDHLSPKRASENIVDTLTDIARIVLTQSSKQTNRTDDNG